MTFLKTKKSIFPRKQPFLHDFGTFFEFDWNSRIRLKSIEIIVDILCFSDVLICLEHF